VNLRRISRRFEELAARRTSGFIAYITAGDPSFEATLDIARALESAGVDLLE
jgi:tryptophan synthase alpha chain